MGLKGELLSVKELTGLQKGRMCQLLNQYFQHITSDCFEHDLKEKDWVIVLSDVESGTIQGFSTQKLIRASVNGVKIRGIFSGDTIIDKEFWGGTELVRKWFDLVFSLLEKDKDSKLYWFLISMGYKTYRFLPVYFHAFYPRFDKETPLHEKSIMDTFSRIKFPDQYNADTGIIHFDGAVACLRERYAEIPEHKLRDPHIRFFKEINPLFESGDELVCLAELSHDNFKPIVHKLMGETISMGA
ncbi:MAG: hypothetical protein COX40_02845 [Candidatus Omnitrophica bacterium CG23_combo_of_CG06-09_8_20_14_all_40_11]|nr:MAG: hypothetical protein COX40_02845 [Candidatus Omnitrophica bacterium CG23_combo_of_CG06-09_8_20_14_all_40_11]